MIQYNPLGKHSNVDLFFYATVCCLAVIHFSFQIRLYQGDDIVIIQYVIDMNQLSFIHNSICKNKTGPLLCGSINLIKKPSLAVLQNTSRK